MLVQNYKKAKKRNYTSIKKNALLELIEEDEDDFIEDYLYIDIENYAVI